MNRSLDLDEYPRWVQSYAEWRDSDERDFLCVKKAYEKFVELTNDEKLSSVLTMAWSNLQSARGGRT